MVAVSIVVATSDPGVGLLGLVRSVDAQTLPAVDFEVVFVDASTDGSDERLRELAARRPNVAVVTAEAGTPEADLLELGRRHATGEHLLVLGQHRRLAPRALELLLARAHGTGAAVVLGRVAGRTASGGAWLPDDTNRVDPSAIDPATCIALLRRERGSVVLDAGPLDADGEAVPALGRYAAAVETAPSAPTDLGIASAAYRWDAGVLHVDAEVSGDRRDLRAWLVVARDTIDLALPASVGEDGTVSADLDPWSAEAGDPLGNGLWELRLRFVGPGGEATLPLPAGPTLSAIVGGRPFVVRAGEEGSQLDVGATRGDVTGIAPQATATVVESARGILLTLDQPTVHVHGDADLDASLLLDGFALRARLVCRDGAARVEALASSLAGVSRIGVALGTGAAVPTGLRLRVDGTGVMTVETVPPPRPRAAPVPEGPPPLVQRVRRRAPAALEPAVRRLARVPALRGAYRRLLKR